MCHLGPEGSVWLIDVFQRKAADKVFQAGCWVSSLFLPTGAHPQLNAAVAASLRPSHGSVPEQGRSVSSPQNPTKPGISERVSTLSPCAAAPSLSCFLSLHCRCVARSSMWFADLGENLSSVLPFFSLVLVAGLHRDNGKGRASFPKVTLTTPDHSALAGSWWAGAHAQSPSLAGFLLAKRQRRRVDAGNSLTKARMVPYLPLCPGLAGMYHSQERRRYITGFEGITAVKFKQL